VNKETAQFSILIQPGKQISNFGRGWCIFMIRVVNVGKSEDEMSVRADPWKSHISKIKTGVRDGDHVSEVRALIIAQIVDAAYYDFHYLIVAERRSSATRD
jgi:hypothetical protein